MVQPSSGTPKMERLEN